MIKNKKKGQRMTLSGSYTVEAAGVMVVVLLTIMFLFNQAFHIHAETSGSFSLHETVEAKRHSIENIKQREISQQAYGMRWSLDLTSPVFRPEDLLRMWTLLE